MRWWRVALALALLGALAAPAGMGKAGDDARSFRIVVSTDFADLNDVYGDHVVWFQGSAMEFDLVLHDLSEGDKRVLTTVAGPGRPLRLQDVSFDGRWVAWSDDRFGNLEVFAFDTAAGSLLRVTEAGQDDVDVTVDAGRIAWSRSRQIWLHDLTNGTSWQVAGTGQAVEPALTGQTIAWIRLDGAERYLVASTLSGDGPATIERVHGSYIHALQGADGVLGWEAWTLRDPAAPVKGFQSTVVQVLPVGGRVQNLTSMPVLDVTHGTPLGLAVGGGRVAWFDVANQTTQVWQPMAGGDEVSTIEYPGTAMALSSQYLVVSQTPSDGHGNLAARPWDAQVRSEPWYAPGPGFVAVLAAGSVAVGLAVRRR